MAHTITEFLGAMDMTLDPVTCPGLVRVDEETLAAKKRSAVPLEEIVALKRALHFEAHYIYFRRFVERPASAVAYIYDWTERLAEAGRSGASSAGHLSKALIDDLTRLHRGVWSACEIPLVYVFLPSRVEIYHILQGPREEKHGIESNPWKTIELAAEAADALDSLKAFSARRLDDGRFWEEHPDARTLKLEGAAFMALSQEIANCRSVLVDEHGLHPDLVKRLLIIFVMIKYLEERKDRNGDGVFPHGTFSKFTPNAQGFVDLLRAGGQAVLAFLDHLADKDCLNGDVFRLETKEREALRKAQLTPFADLLDARIEGAQRTFWRRYAFHELPVELISHLYEQFLPRQPGVVYTPPFLVNFILDEVLPLSQSTPESFRLLDPACGSGVFLVGAFKRIVHRWWRDNEFRDPDVETLKQLLRRHIFGVDIEGEAIRLTMFSLSVALCDFLEPRVIWENLHFDSLQEDNLIKGDFFDFVKIKSWDETSGFDLIVGNPPFKSELTQAAHGEIEGLQKTDPGFDLPDWQLALLFLKTVTRIAKSNAQIALIQPSGPLLYGEGSSRFRKPFLEQVHVSQIVDLTHLSRVLFKRQRLQSTGDAKSTASSNPGDVAVAIVFVENRPPSEEPLLHVTVRRTVQAEQKLMFEIDHYDLHFVSRQEAKNSPSIWKANFIGGGRIPHLMSRLGRLQSLETFLETATRERNWTKGEGYIAGSEEQTERLQALRAKKRLRTLSQSERVQLEDLEKRYKEAPWLTGHDLLPTEAFTASRGIDWSKLTQIKNRFFEKPRTRDLFSPGPLLLIKEVIEAETGTVPVALVTRRKGIRFKHRILGIRAPPSDLTLLKRVGETISNQRLVLFHILAKSPEYLVNKSSAIRAADILSLPFPESAEDLELSPLEEALIDDALDHVADFKRKGGEAAVQQPPRQEELLRFGELFCQVLGSVYKSLGRADPVRLSGGICYPFYFGEAPSERMESGSAGALKLEKLLTATISPSLRCQRILRVFSGNMLLLVKPPQLRYWLRSIAVRDADELFVELQGQGH